MAPPSAQPAPRPGRVRTHAAGARERVREALWPAVLTAIAATLAWVLTHGLLDHPHPFFAPIAAAISLGASRTQRAARVAQMVSGVLLGIVVAEAGQAALGTSTAALGVIVLATVLAALAAGAGFFGEGLMFVNQAAASAVLIVALHSSGTAGERALDAVAGGAAALLVGVLLFPSHPLPPLYRAERGVLEALVTALRRGLGHEDTGMGFSLDAGADIHARLARLAQARRAAHVNVRVAPRRFGLRTVVDAEIRRSAHIDLLANAVLSLTRSVLDQPSRPEALDRDLEQLARLLEELAAEAPPRAAGLTGRVAAASDVIAHRPVGAPGSAEVVTQVILHRAAADLAAVARG